MSETDRELVQVDIVRREIAALRTVQDGKLLRDKLQSAIELAKRQKLQDAANQLQEAKLHVERRLGQMLAETDKRDGGDAMRARSHDVTELPPKLADLGISKMQSSRWQAEASLPEDVFERHVAEVKANGEELTTAGVLQLASRMQRQEAIKDLSRLDQTLETVTKYRCIVIDPPWPIQKIEREVRPMQGQVLDYPTMTIDEIAALPVLEQADPDGSHIYLWVTHKYLPAGLQLLERWGFRYQCLMTWVKNVGFTPFSWMYSTEHVLFGRVGSLDLLRLGMRLDFTGKVREHSRKPDEFYELVRQASPGPRLEMFARESREGFDGWGNESNRFADTSGMAI